MSTNMGMYIYTHTCTRTFHLYMSVTEKESFHMVGSIYCYHLFITLLFFISFHLKFSLLTTKQNINKSLPIA